MSMLDYSTGNATDWKVPVVAIPRGPTPIRWTREEYYYLAEQGWFRDQRVELIDGEILQSPPQSPGHYWSIDQLFRLLNEIFPLSADY